YWTYTRTIGRGYTLDDPDTVAYTLTTLSSFVYIIYDIQILMDPKQYAENSVYYYGVNEPCTRCCRRCFQNDLDIRRNNIVPTDEKQSSTNNTKDSENRV
ncbi:unnamed protein product, partial [Rotaria sordida]